MEGEHSAHGGRVYRHTQRRPEEFVSGDEGLIDAVGEHVEEHFGEVETVYHEIISTHAHVDLFVAKPGPKRPATTVVTCGMAQFPMPGFGKGELSAELCLILPPDWPIMDDPAFDERLHYWPFRVLKELARLPHEFGTTLWYGHTVPNGDPAQPYGPNTKLCCAMLAEQIMADEAAHRIAYGDREIALWGVWLLHKDEMQYKLDHGLEAVQAYLDEAKVSEIVKPDRPSALPQKRRRGLFRR